jgi:hypothetical protein
MVEVVGLLFVFILSVALAIGAALAVLGVLLEMMRRRAARPSLGSLVPGTNGPLGAPVQRCRCIPSRPRRRRTARRRALWFLAVPAARRGGSAFRGVPATATTAPHRSSQAERRHRLTIDRLRVQRVVNASRQRVEVAARIGLLCARTHGEAR